MRITFTQEELIATMRANGSIPEGLTLFDLSISHDDLEYEVCNFELHLDMNFDAENPPESLCASLKLIPQSPDQ
jgi:hypothetical protein